MARLVLIHESGVTGEFDLRPGVNTVGRGADNDLSIDHESVSDHHCEIAVTTSGIVVRDLDSSNGTWIDTARVQEARLGPGQTLQLGEVQFALQTAVRVGGKTAQPGVREIGPASRATVVRSPLPGSVYCTACDQWWTLSATREQRIGMSVLHFCPQCARQCVAQPSASGADPDDAAAMNFARGVADAFGYPIRAHGVWMLLSGAVALLITQYAAMLARFAFLLGLFALVILAIGVIGYFFAFVKDIVATSAAGRDTLPDWPEIARPTDFLAPFFHFLSLMVISFGPWLLWEIWGPEFGEPWMPWVLAGLGVLYCPMALVGLALADSIAGLNPVLVVSSILRILGHYFVVVILVVLLMGLQSLGGWLAEVVPLPLITPLAVHFLTLYLLVVAARILGILYSMHREELGWFR